MDSFVHFGGSTFANLPMNKVRTILVTVGLHLFGQGQILRFSFLVDVLLMRKGSVDPALDGIEYRRSRRQDRRALS